MFKHNIIFEGIVCFNITICSQTCSLQGGANTFGNIVTCY